MWSDFMSVKTRQSHVIFFKNKQFIWVKVTSTNGIYDVAYNGCLASEDKSKRFVLILDTVGHHLKKRDAVILF